MSSFARVRNLLLSFAWDLAAVRIIGESVIAECSQGESSQDSVPNQSFTLYPGCY